MAKNTNTATVTDVPADEAAPAEITARTAENGLVEVPEGITLKMPEARALAAWNAGHDRKTGAKATGVKEGRFGVDLRNAFVACGRADMVGKRTEAAPRLTGMALMVQTAKDEVDRLRGLAVPAPTEESLRTALADRVKRAEEALAAFEADVPAALAAATEQYEAKQAAITEANAAALAEAEAALAAIEGMAAKATA